MPDRLKKTNDILDSSRQAIDNTTLATAHLNSVSARIDSGLPDSRFQPRQLKNRRA